MPVTAGYLDEAARPRTAIAFLPPLDLENNLGALAKRMVIVLTLLLGTETYLFGYPGHFFSSLAAGLFKALFWYSLIQTHLSWRVAVAISTFSLAAMRDPALKTTDYQAAMLVITSLLSLAQVLQLVPREAKYYTALFAFVLIPAFPYISNLRTIYTIRAFSSSDLVHPVEQLMSLAKKDFDALLQRQSQNLTAASNEYRRRYGMEPPPGFDAWFSFAQAQKSRIIDDFDVLHSSLASLYTLSGQQIQVVMRHAYDQTPNSELWQCVFSHKTKQTSCSHHHRRFDRHLQLLFDTMLVNTTGIRLPDVQFLANHLDEPRVLVPSGVSTDYHLTVLSHKPTWDKLTQYCPEEAIRDATGAMYAVPTFGLSFVQHRQEALNLCRHAEYEKMHGLLQSPTSFPLLEGHVPVLTTGTLSTMGDILYPSAAYLVEDEFRYDEGDDLPWEKKHNQLYWAGSTTGGYAEGDVRSDGYRHHRSWPSFQRQRFVDTAQNLDKKAHRYLRPATDGGDDTNGWIPWTSSFLNGRLFDVAFTRVFQCATVACRAQRAHFRTSAWAPRSQALRARLAFDVDGNGISGRFYKLLASRSCPLKQTLLREWHDDRLLPWVHYVPVSASLDELPELVRYLTSLGPGERMAHTIAEQGRAWFSQALRPIDMTIYTYRLLLELARLQDPMRPAMHTKNTTI